MKILFLSTDFKPNPGGIAELSFHVCRELVGLGHEVRVVSNETEGEPSTSTMDGIDVYRTFPPRPRASRRNPLGLLKVRRWGKLARGRVAEAVTDFAPDIVLAGNYRSELMDRLLPACGRPFAMILHGGELARSLMQGIWGRRRGLRKLIQNASRVFCNSRFTLGLAEEVAGKSLGHASAIGCGFPVDRIVGNRDRAAARKTLGYGDVPLVLTVSRLVKQKGIDTVIRAWPRIRESFPEARYLVVGKGPDQAHFQELAAQLGVGDAVEFPGFVSVEKKNLLYEAGDLYVMPSRSSRERGIEGFGISFLEAGAHGLAVIGSTAGGIPDAVADGETGLLVPPDSPEALAEAAIELLGDPGRCSRMASAAQARIRTRFNWQHIARLVEQELQAAVSGEGA